MTQTKPTTRQNGKARLSIVGFVELSGTNSLIVRVPDATYLLSRQAWGSLRYHGRTWGTEISRVTLEDEMAANSVQWMISNGAIIINDLADCRKFCLREDDLMNIAEGQQLPVYGRDNPSWKYKTATIQQMERALPAVV